MYDCTCTPDRNYARKDQSGDPFQADVCCGCKQEYIAYRKGLGCSVGGFAEIAIPLIPGNTDVRECNKRIRNRFGRTETVPNFPLKATPERGPMKSKSPCPLRRKRAPISSADNTPNSESLDMPGLVDFQMNPTWSGESSGQSVTPILKGGGETGAVTCAFLG